MNVRSKNLCFRQGNLSQSGLFPHKELAEAQELFFEFNFGLNKLPNEPGLITVRGPRQFGKSTWLEIELYKTLKEFGAGSAFYLNGDDLSSADALQQEIELLIPFFSQGSVRRLFIDEITAVPDWQRIIKRLIDRGDLKDVLVITTGSKALDLRRGNERLPGRKGKLSRSEYIFLPLSYQAFAQKTESRFKDNTWIAYLLSGGSPLMANDLWQHGKLQDYAIQLTRDWILGELVASGRNRQSLFAILQYLLRVGGSPVGYAKLARETGLANNTVASGYIEQLSDLLCLMPSWPWDSQKEILILRKPCKFHFINLAAAVAFHPSALRSVADWEGLDADDKAKWLEWLVAQELWRRSILAQDNNSEALAFWQSKTHEIDFFSPAHEYIEVKLGKASPFEFDWFCHIFPKTDLTVICKTPFSQGHISGKTIDTWLREVG